MSLKIKIPTVFCYGTTNNTIFSLQDLIDYSQIPPLFPQLSEMFSSEGKSQDPVTFSNTLIEFFELTNAK